MIGYQIKRTLILLAFLSFFYLLTNCGEGSAVDKIRKTGEIAVLTRNNAHCYYNYRGQPMGFEYDMAKEFSNYLGVELKIVTPSWDGLLEKLKNKEGDIVAASLTITPSREADVDFSESYLNVQQQVILRADNHRIKRIEDLNGEEIHVRKGTSYQERLTELKEDGLDIQITTYEDIPTEELIGMVVTKEIEITVADSNIALLNRRYYPDIKMAFPLEESQDYGWAVKKGEDELLNEINKFFTQIKEDGTFQKIYEKYYAYVEIFDYFDLKKYHQRIDTRLPKYKDIIKQASEQYEFDWRLIAAMIYQESHFNPNARSHTGVKGLMQLTIETAKEMGVKNRRDPEASIMGGVKYLKRLYDLFEEAKDPDRMLIALASYNVGRGHVLDAQGIAKDQGLDPNSWASLVETLPLLRNPTYYKKSRYGYCRGTEPVRYVKRILTYYDILKREAIEVGSTG